MLVGHVLRGGHMFTALIGGGEGSSKYCHVSCPSFKRPYPEASLRRIRGQDVNMWAVNARPEERAQILVGHSPHLKVNIVHLKTHYKNVISVVCNINKTVRAKRFLPLLCVYIFQQ